MPAAEPDVPSVTGRRLLLQDWPEGGEPGRPTASWQCGRTGAAGADLLVAFRGHPQGLPRGLPPAYTVTAVAEPARISVTVEPTAGLAHSQRRGRRLVARIGLLRVRLPEPAAGRPIVDARTGKTPPVFNGDALLRPTQQGACPPEHEGGLGYVPLWWQAYRATGSGAMYTILHAVDHGQPLGSAAAHSALTIRGSKGVGVEHREGSPIMSREVSWREGAALVTLRSEQGQHGSSTALDALSYGELVHIANTLG